LPGRRVEHLAVVRRARRVVSRKRVAPHRVVVLGSEERPVGHQATRADEQRRHTQRQFCCLSIGQGRVPDRGLGDAARHIFVWCVIRCPTDGYPVDARRCTGICPCIFTAAVQIYGGGVGR